MGSEVRRVDDHDDYVSSRSSIVQLSAEAALLSEASFFSAACAPDEGDAAAFSGLATNSIATISAASPTRRLVLMMRV